VKLLFDTSVWVEHLRHNALDSILPGVRGRFVLWFDAVSAAELRAGCRRKRERDVVGRLLSPFEKAGRLAVPNAGDYARTATALSRLREDGKTLKQPGSALLDATIAAVGVRLGALVVTMNIGDFTMLADALPLHVESMSDFAARI
jgi:predicted nucleic acid-binding protein